MQGDDLIDVLLMFYRCAPGVRITDAVWDTGLYVGHCVPHSVQPPGEHGTIHPDGHPHSDALHNIRYVDLNYKRSWQFNSFEKKTIFLLSLSLVSYILHNLATFYREILFYIYVRYGFVTTAVGAN